MRFHRVELSSDGFCWRESEAGDSNMMMLTCGLWGTFQGNVFNPATERTVKKTVVIPFASFLDFHTNGVGRLGSLEQVCIRRTEQRLNGLF